MQVHRVSMDRTTEATEPALTLIGRRFPRLTATAISGRTVTLPDDAQGAVSLVVVAFLETARPMVESWSGPFEQAFTGNPRVKTYLVLVVGDRLGEPFSGRVDEAMRGGIPPEKYDQVLTYAGDAEQCRRLFGIDDPSLAYVYLVDGDGIVRWMEKVTATPEGLDSLLNTAHDLLSAFWR